MISVFLNLLRLVLWPYMWSILGDVPCSLEKNVYTAAFGWNGLCISIKSKWSKVLRPVFLYWFSIWMMCLFGEGNGTPLQYSCLENPMDGGAWWTAVHGVTKSQTWLSDFTFTFHFHALEKEMATHSNILAWRIPGTAEPGGLLSMGSHKVGHDWSDLEEEEGRIIGE